MKTGVYLIRIGPRTSYVGSSCRLKVRRAQHLSCLRGGRHPNPILQRSFNKHGGDALSWKVLELCDESSQLSAENQWIQALRPSANLAPVAGTVRGVRWSEQQRSAHSERCKGRKVTKAAREALSAALTGRPKPPGFGKKIAEANRRRPVTKATRAKISAARRGAVASEETREKLSQAGRGRPVSKETRRKLSEAMEGVRLWEGRKHSEQSKRKIGDAHRGKQIPQEVRDRISQKLKGRKQAPFSAERRANMSAAAKRRWQKQREATRVP